MQVVNALQHLFKVVAADAFRERPIFLEIVVHFATIDEFLHDVDHLFRLTILFVVSRVLSIRVVAHEVWVVHLLQCANFTIHVLPELIGLHNT